MRAVFLVFALFFACAMLYATKPPKYTCAQAQQAILEYGWEVERFKKLVYKTEKELYEIKKCCKAGDKKKCDLIYPYEEWVKQYKGYYKYYVEQVAFWEKIAKMVCKKY